MQWGYKTIGAQIDYSEMETSGNMLFQKITAPHVLRAWDNIIAGFFSSQQHTLFKISDTDVNITLEYKISNFVPRLFWGSGSRRGVLNSILTFSICPHIFFAIQYKGICSQFKRLYMKLFDSELHSSIFKHMHVFFSVLILWVSLKLMPMIITLATPAEAV